MKKIFFYIDGMQYGGANRIMANLTEYFSEKDYEVTLLNDDLPVQGKLEYEINSKIKRRYLTEIGRNGNSFVSRNINRIYAIRKIVESENPDVIVSFMGPPNIRMLIATIGLKTKKIVSVRNDPNKEYGTGWKKTFAGCIFHLADGCVFQTDQAAAYFSKKIRERSRVIYNPVNDVFYCQPIIPNRRVIAFVGRLQPQKNPSLLLRAFARIKDDFPEYQLIYYGAGELQLLLEQEAVRLNVEKQVVFYGQTSNIPEKLASSTCYVLCSDYEGMPNALMEAMAVGLPVISTDCPCGGPRMLIQNEEQGTLVQCGNEQQLADAIKRILVSHELREQMRVSSKMRAQEFQSDIISKTWEEFLFSSV